MKYIKFILLIMAAFSGVVPIIVLGEDIIPVINISLPSPFPKPQETFSEAMDILKKQSYSVNLNDEIVYYSALKGVLRHLSPENNKELLKIWPPEVDKIVQANISGTIGSIGIRFLQDAKAGVAFISDVMPGTPAERQGLRLRDRIEAIDGVSLKGKSPNDVASMIERPVGTKMKLSLSRAGRKINVALPSELIKVDDVRGEVINGVGILRIRYFNQNAAYDIEKEAKVLREKKVKGIIFDLRNNSGGLLDAALKAADQFLAKGSTILYTVGRDGAPQRYYAGLGGDVTTPVAILINGETGSAAELFAAALRDNKRAKIVGVPSMGKGTTEAIAKLKNGYSMTFTTAALYGPSGETWQGRGVVPSEVVDIPRSELEQAYMEEDVAKRLARDKQLSAAMDVLTAEPRK